jgi:hypothetical protein
VATPHVGRAGKAARSACVTIRHPIEVDVVGRGRININQKVEEMRNVGRKTFVTAGIAVALAVGPGVGMANAQVELPEADLEGVVEPVGEVAQPFLEALFPEREEPETPEWPD